MNLSHEWLSRFVPHGKSAEQIRDLLTAHVATVEGFEGHMDVSVGRAAEGFSGGELQRLGLARLLVNSPTRLAGCPAWTSSKLTCSGWNG